MTARKSKALARAFESVTEWNPRPLQLVDHLYVLPVEVIRDLRVLSGVREGDALPCRLQCLEELRLGARYFEGILQFGNDLPDDDRLQLELALHLSSRLGLGTEVKLSQKLSRSAA